MRRDPVVQPAQAAADLVDRSANPVVGDPDDQVAIAPLGANLDSRSGNPAESQRAGKV